MISLPPLQIGDLCVRIPIIQGGMGVGVSLSGLASAVANEGGVGVIATIMVGMDDPEVFSDSKNADAQALRREIRRARSLTNGALGVNIMVAASNYATLVETAVEEGIDLIFAGAGLPLDLPHYLNGATRPKLLPIVSSGRAASLICKKWAAKFTRVPDAFVVEGPMAGGHLGLKLEQINDPAFALEHLVPEVIAAVKPFEAQYGRPIPIIAAGGIYTGADIHKFLQMGAAGVQMGTRFVMSDECNAHPKLKERFVKARAREAMSTPEYDKRLPIVAVRALKNKSTEEFGRLQLELLQLMNENKIGHAEAQYKVESFWMGGLRKAAVDGDVDRGSCMAGQSVGLVDKVQPMKEIFAELLGEAEAELEAVKARLAAIGR